MIISKDKVVAITYELEVEGAIADRATKERPLEYIHGNHNLLEKFEQNLEGKTAGDLFVVMHVRQNRQFERDGYNLWTGVTTTYPRLVLGGTAKVKTLDGKSVELNVPAGTQVGSVLRIPGEGLPKGGSTTARGDLFVRVRIEVPKTVSKEDRELLVKLDSSNSQESGSISKKIKDAIFGKK